MSRTFSSSACCKGQDDGQVLPDAAASLCHGRCPSWWHSRAPRLLFGSPPTGCGCGAFRCCEVAFVWYVELLVDLVMSRIGEPPQSGWFSCGLPLKPSKNNPLVFSFGRALQDQTPEPIMAGVEAGEHVFRSACARTVHSRRITVCFLFESAVLELHGHG